MKLWEDMEIVDALNKVLLSYEYLEYDEKSSKGINGLCVRVKETHLNTERHISVVNNICRDLKEATGRSFFIAGVVNAKNWQTDWTFFNLREESQDKQPHENVKITYPHDRADTIVVEYYADEHCHFNRNDPNLLHYVDENDKINIKTIGIDRKTDKTIFQVVYNKIEDVFTTIVAKSVVELISKFCQ